jgi:hypothetical protein
MVQDVDENGKVRSTTTLDSDNVATTTLGGATGVLPDHAADPNDPSTKTKQFGTGSLAVPYGKA